MAESVGALLRETREARGLTLEDVERATRIRIKYLAAIEADEFQAIASPAQARGFLRNYSHHLGLDSDEVLALFDTPARRSPLGALARVFTRPRPAKPNPPPTAAEAAPTVAPPFVSPVPKPRRSLGLAVRRLRWISADVIVGAIVVAALVGFFVWGSSRLASVLFQTTPEATPLELGRANQSATPTLGSTGVVTATVAIPATAPPQLVALTNVPVSLQFEQTAWVLVTVDGQEAFRGLVAPGTVQDYLGVTSVEVLTANAAGVRVNYGGIDYGVMGSFGEVVDRIYTLNGAVAPTPSATPEITETFTPRPVTDTPTPRPTPSPRFSPTPAGSPTPIPSSTVRPTETVPPSPTTAP